MAILSNIFTFDIVKDALAVIDMPPPANAKQFLMMQLITITWELSLTYNPPPA
jgi:hypothetical protein